MDPWQVAMGLGFDFGDFNDWTDAATRPGSPNLRYFTEYGASLKAAKTARTDWLTWAEAHAGAPDFEAGFRRRGLKLKALERRAVKALEDLLAAYRQDTERG